MKMDGAKMWWGTTRCNISLMARVLFVFLIVSLTSIISVSAVDVTGPTVITSPGVYYLQNDILENTTTKVIDIQSSDVVFDGMGHLIDGVGGVDTFGIHAGDYDRVTVRNVSVQDFDEGIKYYLTSQSYILNSTFRNNTYGVSLTQCDNIQVNGNSVVENVDLGIDVPLYFNHADQKTISFSLNNISSNGNSGLFIHEFGWYSDYYKNQHSRDITVLSNIISNNDGFGIDLASIRDADIIQNNILNNKNTGVQIADGFNGNPRDTYISGNLISGNNAAGVYFNQVKNSQIVDNIITNQGGYGIHFQNVVRSNAVTNNTVTDNNSGLHLQDSTTTQNTIENNTFSDNANYGVFFLSSGTNTFNNNQISNNTNTGFKLSGSSSNTITNCTISGNNINGVEFLSASNSNTFRDNTVSNNNENGIYLSGSNTNTLNRNTISGNVLKGIFAYQSQSNTIANNHFNNANNADLSTVMYANSWNTTNSTGPNIVNGPYLGGNYWANPSGTGFSQTCTDSNGDGFCDSPNTLATNNTDGLPLHAQTATHTITASAGSGGTISPVGAITVADGGSQTFTITPNTGYQILDVLVNGNSAGVVPTYTFSNVKSDQTIHATFTQAPPTSHTITATAGPGGSISPSGAVVVPLGGNQTFAITPNTGFIIQDVVVDGSSVGNVTSYPFINVTTNHTIAASFQAVTQVHFILASAGTGGSIDPTGLVPVVEGNAQQFNITASNCYTVSNVIVDGKSQGPQSSWTFTNVVTNHTIQAQFTQLTYNITATAGTGGSITPSGTVNVPCGGSQTFTIAPATNYDVEFVAVDGQQVGALRSYTFTNVVANHLISANFTKIPGTYAINSTSDPWTIIYPKGTKTYQEGANKTYLTQAKPGADLTNLIVDNYTYPPQPGGNWTFTNITADHNISTIGQATPGQVHVLFDISPTYGPAPLPVTFTNSSLGNPTSFYWQFGDGQNATSENAQHTYLLPGVYTVTLRAMNAQSGGVGVWTNAVTVTDGVIPKPTPTPQPGSIRADFTANPMTGSSPLNVQFQDLSTGNPVTWTWDFGDGQISNLRSPLHQYTNPGSYSVSLLVQNGLNSGSLYKPGYITVL